jgi:hypothetical protein
MKENVGNTDRAIRFIVGPALIVASLTALGARLGRTSGLLALVGGTMIVESAITRTCPLNALLGIDTR